MSMTSSSTTDIHHELQVCDNLHRQKKYLEALRRYDALTTQVATSALVWNNRGVTLLAMGQHAEAMSSFSRALQCAPALQQAKVALASCYHALGLFDQALSCCNQVLSQNPHNAEAHWNKSLLLLLNGNFREGWQEYEWRWKKDRFTSPQRKFPQPLWQGECITGATILVHAEQGYGDTLQFCRYLNLMEQLGMTVLFECQPPLVSLVRSLSPTITVLTMGAPLPPFDLHIPLVSLPRIFNTLIDTIPARIPYLTPPGGTFPEDNQLTESDNGHLKVGLCWAGKQYPDPARSCPTSFLHDLGFVKGVDWYSLQVGWTDTLPFPMIDLTGYINDFADTARLLSHLDLVISIDTAVAHLAGAMGKQTWVMLPFVPDWRWLLARNDSPWYPGMKIYRQDLPGNWHNLVQSISHVLQSKADQHAAKTFQ